MAELITVAVTDDEPEVRDAYRVIFSRHPEFALCGEACDGPDGVALFLRQRPDVMLMDLKMPGMSGVDATAVICRHLPQACILALTTFGTLDLVVAALRAGASGYLLKDCSADGLTVALRQAIAGEMPLSPAVRIALVDSIRSDRGATTQTIQPLTDRETELLRWLAMGLGNQDIARKMYVSEGSVKQYLSHIGDKLGVRSRTQILVRSLQLGVVSLQ